MCKGLEVETAWVTWGGEGRRVLLNPVIEDKNDPGKGGDVCGSMFKDFGISAKSRGRISNVFKPGHDARFMCVCVYVCVKWILWLQCRDGLSWGRGGCREPTYRGDSRWEMRVACTRVVVVGNGEREIHFKRD